MKNTKLFIRMALKKSNILKLHRTSHGDAATKGQEPPTNQFRHITEGQLAKILNDYNMKEIVEDDPAWNLLQANNYVSC